METGLWRSVSESLLALSMVLVWCVVQHGSLACPRVPVSGLCAVEAQLGASQLFCLWGASAAFEPRDAPPVKLTVLKNVAACDEAGDTSMRKFTNDPRAAH
ncbi:hypothetical protein PBY51_015292 [Eleginops maclovinus]|uniref:Secreted protein n=1 Tax=Eleginops maclovinus TaxID=56733 RepID=A0AAN8A8L0_ELEMC|nr:hypothetical protein PBY51_015292 [Eleginops maclovinus]